MSLLKDLYNQDLLDRHSVDWDHATSEELDRLNIRDETRRKKVIELFMAQEIKDPLDFHYAALIMQHGTISSDFKIAHEFAEHALSLGDETAKWLYAATLDRWLLSDGNAQRYGTQFKKNELGEWEQAQPIDPLVTDEERAIYDVPPLKNALEIYLKKYPKKT